VQARATATERTRVAVQLLVRSPSITTEP
jgi:hypothetical protein